MNGTDYIETFNHVLGKLHLCGDSTGKVRDPELVIGSIGVSGFNRGHYDLNSSVDGMPETVEAGRLALDGDSQSQ